jgi:hypothetical protein
LAAILPDGESEMMEHQEIELTGPGDEAGLGKLSAFLSLSPSRRALVSTEVRRYAGKRSLLIYVRQDDGELGSTSVFLPDGMTGKDIVKQMRADGFWVRTVPLSDI